MQTIFWRSGIPCADVNVLESIHYLFEDVKVKRADIKLENGADYTIASMEQVTPMQIAVEKGLEEVLELMV